MSDVPEFEDEAAFDRWLKQEQDEAVAAGQTMDVSGADQSEPSQMLSDVWEAMRKHGMLGGP